VTSGYPLAATWWSLLPGDRPGTRGCGGRVRPAPVSRLAAVIGVLVLATGVAGGIVHTGLLFAPALVAFGCRHRQAVA
jgi:hypothetical protein